MRMVIALAGCLILSGCLGVKKIKTPEAWVAKPEKPRDPVPPECLKTVPPRPKPQPVEPGRYNTAAQAARDYQELVRSRNDIAGDYLVCRGWAREQRDAIENPKPSGKTSSFRGKRIGSSIR